MNLRVSCALAKATKSINEFSSRALTTLNHHYAPEDDFVSLNNQISSFTDDVSAPDGLNDVLRLQQLNESPRSPYLFNKILSDCARSGSLDVGIQLHPLIVKKGFTSNLYICTALVDFYGKCGEILSCQRVFDKMHQKNIVTWNSLISGYLHVRSPDIAVELFIKMLKAGIEPTAFSVSVLLVGCSQLEDQVIGAQVHGLSLKFGLCNNVVVETNLVDMYSKCCNIEESRQVFDQMQEKNTFTWTSMVAGYAQSGQPNKAMILVREMLRLGLRVNNVIYNSLMSCFSSMEYLDCCKQIHCRVIREGFESNTYVMVTLVNVYSKCNCSLKDFEKVSSSITRWDQISWNAVITGFCNFECSEQALKCFSEMRRSGNQIDYFTFTSIIGAIGVSSGLKDGKQMHALIFKTGYAKNVPVQNALVSMYARCGIIEDSKKVFSSMNKHDVISWNSLLSGCAHHGYAQEAVELFEQMRRTEIQPDGTTFLAVLSACSHAGSIDKGLEYFYLMKNDASFEPPKIEHYATVVDLFGRAGYLNEAESFISSMPIDPGPSVYKALLSACQIHGSREIAERSAKKLLELCPNDPATYVILSNVFKMGGYWDRAIGLQTLMCDRRVRKKPGCSWV